MFPRETLCTSHQPPRGSGHVLGFRFLCLQLPSSFVDWLRTLVLFKHLRDLPPASCDLHHDLVSELFGKIKENEEGDLKEALEKPGKKALKYGALCYSWPRFTDEKNLETNSGAQKLNRTSTLTQNSPLPACNSTPSIVDHKAYTWGSVVQWALPWALASGRRP